MHGSLTIMTVEVQAHKPQGTFLDEEYVYTQVIAGRWDFRMADRRYLLGPSDLVLMPPYLLHTVRPHAGSRFVLYVSRFTLNDPLPELAQAPLAVTVPAAIRDEARTIFDRLLAEWQGDEPHRGLMLQALLHQILALYLRHSGAARPFEANNTRAWKNIADAVAFIQARHDDRNLAIADIAAAAGLSPAHFSRLFKACIGLSPWQYLCRYRIERAKELLMNGKRSCSDVALATGHVDLAAFSRAFRRVEGRPPTRWLDTTVFPGR